MIKDKSPSKGQQGKFANTVKENLYVGMYMMLYMGVHVWLVRGGVLCYVSSVLGFE